MKKLRNILVAGIATIIIASTMVGCNMQMVDMTYSFEKAIVYLPNGEVVEGKVDSWLDFENSDMIQVKIDGKTYLTHISNVVLISD